jgi:Zn-dependent protease
MALTAPTSGSEDDTDLVPEPSQAGITAPATLPALTPLAPVVAPIALKEEARVRRSLTRVLSGFLLMVGVIALKLKALLFLAFENFRLLLVNPFEGFGAVQYAVAGGSMLLSIGAYATKWPLGLGVGFMTIILVHEVGHAVVIRAKGLRAGMMVFIPFIGGAVTLKDQPTSVYDDAQIGLAGPLAGTFASLVALQIYKWTGTPLYLLIAFAGFVINLVNLLPIGMLDGGRISAAVTKWMWVFGGAALTYKVIKQPNPIMILVLVLAIFQVYASIMREKSDKFYEITKSQRVAVAVAYFSLIVFLGHQAYMSLERLSALKQ